ncbi:hypothetical protein VTN96DRAFT_2830 [Rasamsonia emersonii]
MHCISFLSRIKSLGAGHAQRERSSRSTRQTSFLLPLALGTTLGTPALLSPPCKDRKLALWDWSGSMGSAGAFWIDRQAVSQTAPARMSQTPSD